MPTQTTVHHTFQYFLASRVRQDALVPPLVFDLALSSLALASAFAAPLRLRRVDCVERARVCVCVCANNVR